MLKCVVFTCNFEKFTASTFPKSKKIELFDLIKICCWDNSQELIIGDFYLFVSLENKVLVIFLFSHYKVV
jgi:hypothetical protein